MSEGTSLTVISNYLSDRLRAPFLRAINKIGSDITEIRIYLSKPLTFVFPDRNEFLTLHSITSSIINNDLLLCSSSDIDMIIDSVTHYSYHSHIKEFRLGYFVIEKGIRVGISGVYNSDSVITNVTGICFRIPRNKLGGADSISSLIYSSSGILICGGVNSGKTTLLRDICRFLGRSKKIVLIDDRNEIAAISNGQVSNDVGILTNIMTFCPRYIGILSAIRSLSPDYIICDEIADESDTAAIIQAAGCGVKFIASIHANSYEDLKLRPFTNNLLSSKLFSHVIILSGSSTPGDILCTYEL